MIMDQQYLPIEIHDCLASGGLVITANQRLARHLEQQYGRHQQLQGAQAWVSPAILPWQTWLESCWEQLSLVSDEVLPRLLSAQQERQCWLNIVQQDVVDDELMQTSALAQTAQQAWSLCQHWQVPQQDLTSAGNDGTTRYLQWAKSFQLLCDENQWLDNARLAALLTTRLDELLPTLPDTVRLAGFDEVSPDQMALIESLATAGVDICHLEQAVRESRQQKIMLADSRQELVAAAQWARQQYESGVADIAVIIPDLTRRSTEVMRIFDDVLCPSFVLPGMHITDRPYTISMGRSLAEVPLARMALILCQSIGSSLSYDLISAILHSLYISGADSERGGRVALDIYLRDRNVVTASIWRLKSLVAQFAEGKTCPQFLSLLESVINFADRLPKYQGAAAWAQSFVELLKCFGWPGRSLNSEEYQAYSHWDDVISELAALDAFTDRLTHAAALSMLQRIAREKVFQAKSAPAPIQVLGALEASGMQFDAMYVTGMTDEAWPPAASPNALLPVSVQRKYDMPHSSSEREFAFVETLHRRIAGSAETVVFSWPAMEGDKELAPSPFIREVAAIDAADIAGAELSPYARRIRDEAPMLEVALDSPVELKTGDNTRGGTGLVKQQSACPFSAFAFYRLNIRPLEEPEVGLDSRQRGSLVHTVMQAIWQKLQTHEQLCALQDIPATIKPVIEECVEGFVRQQAQTSPGRFVELEKNRLLQRITQWLEVEKLRTPFSIAALEQKSTSTIGELQISTQLDRLDKTEQGLIAIDYKTGEPRPAAWLGERPEEPQLPLYVQFDSLMQGSDVAGVMFGCLKKGAETAFAGIVADGVVAPGAKTPDRIKAFRDLGINSLEDARHYWQQTLLDLAHAYASGDAVVDPRDANTCLYCGLESLCRVYELNKRLEHNGRLSDGGGS